MGLKTIPIGVGLPIAEGVKFINDAINAAEQSKIESSNAVSTANSANQTAQTAETKADSVQSQFNQVVIEGDSSVEAAQARVDTEGDVHATLKARLDDEHSEATSRLADKSQQNYPTSTVFSSGDFGSLYFRIPFMAVTKNGTIIAGSDIRYDGKSDFGNHDIGIARRVDKGKTWIDKQVIISHNNITVDSRVMDACIIYNEVQDKIYIFAVKLDDNVIWYDKTDKTNWDLVYVTSDDDGLTWSAETSIASVIDSFTDRVIFLTGVGSGIVMNDGTIVLPIQSSKVGQSPHRMQSGIVYSQDGGLTWKMSQSLLPELSSECNVVEYEDGKLLINTRNDDKEKRNLYFTEDLGTIWVPTKSNYPADPERLLQITGVQGSMIKANLPNGKQKIVFSNPHTLNGLYPYNRKNISVQTSDDGGEKWNMITSVLPGESNGYSCLAGYGNKIYILLEIDGNIVFKDISKIYSLVERDEKLNELANGVYGIFVSAAGDNNNTGLTSSEPLQTMAEALKRAPFGKGTTIEVKILDDLTENIDIKNIIESDSLSFAGYGTVVNVGYINAHNIHSSLFFRNITFSGALDTTNGNKITNCSNVITIDTTFKNSSSRSLLVTYSTINFVRPRLSGGTQDGIRLDSNVVASIDEINIDNSNYQNGIVINYSFLTLGNTTTSDNSYTNSYSFLKDTVKPILMLGMSNVRCNLFISAIEKNGWEQHTYEPLKTVTTGIFTNLHGMIIKGSTAPLTQGTVIATLQKILPRYSTYKTAHAYVDSGTISILVKINANGDISLAQDISDATLASMILSNISFENDI